MKYEEIVAKVKKAYAKADTALVDEHLAVQVDVTGEGEGAFYIEVADGKINVEPWEYLDHDFKIQCTAEEIIEIAEGKKKLGVEVEAGNVFITRNFDKVAVFDLIVAKKSTAKKAAPAKKAAKAEKPAKAEKAPKAEKPAKVAKAPKAEKPAKAEKAPKAAKAPKAEKVAKVEAPKAEAPKAEAPAEVKAEAPKKRGRKPKTEAKA